MDEFDDSSDIDREVRDSIRVMNQQRSTKKWAVLFGLVVALIALFGAVFLAYRDEPDAAKKPTPGATP